MSIHNLDHQTSYNNIAVNSITTNEIIADLDAIQDVTINNPQPNEVLTYNGGWVNAVIPSVSNTTASNILPGEGLFAQKVSNDLQFKSIIGSGIQVTSNSGQIILTVPIETGEYTANVFNLSNINSFDIFNTFFTRINNIVTCQIIGDVNFNSTSSTLVHMDIELPIEPDNNWSSSGPCGGQMTVHNHRLDILVQASQIGNKHCHILFDPNSTGIDERFSLNISYKINN